MGLRLFSSSRYDDDMGVRSFVKYAPRNDLYDSPPKLPNPDPSNYRILKFKELGGNLIVRIKYPDCTNYEGEKVLFYTQTSLNDLLEQRTIDPHFAQNKQFKSPFARFEPTEAGWAAAELLASAMRL